MIDKNNYKFHEKIHDHNGKSTKRIHCNFLEYVIIMREFEYLTDIIDYCKCLKNNNIIEDFKIERNNIFLIDKKCLNKKEECCCLCKGTIYINNNVEKCKLKQEHGYCENFQRLCW